MLHRFVPRSICVSTLLVHYTITCFPLCCRHPEFWPRASEWLPERWLPFNLKALGPQHPDAFMPFSAGSRSCIGRYFAMLEMQVGLGFMMVVLEHDVILV